MTKQKQRHGCLTAWLILMLISNLVTMLFNAFPTQAMKQAYPTSAVWAFPILMILSLFNFVSAIALLKWKKWGFWALFVSSILILGVNLTIGIKLQQAIISLAGILILFGILHIGKENKGWRQLD